MRHTAANGSSNGDDISSGRCPWNRSATTIVVIVVATATATRYSNRKQGKRTESQNWLPMVSQQICEYHTARQ